MSTEQQPPIWLEVAAAFLVPAACIGFSRVFEDTSTILPILGASLLSSAVAVLSRRLRVPLIGATVISLGLLAALVINRYASGTATLGIIPTAETGTALRALFDDLITNFQELQTPVPALQPFEAAAMVGAWIMAFLTDWGAMRLRLAFEPVLPAALLFIFTAIPPVSAGENQLISTVAFGAGVAAWAVSQRAANLLQRGVWLSNDHRRGPAYIASTGAVVAVIAVLAGAVLGGRLPGAGADPIYTFQDQGDPTRVVVSPFVNIRSRLVNQTGRELFTVTANEAAYWRIAGLDTYEDNIWKVAGDFSPQTGVLPGQETFAGPTTPLTQQYSISALAAIWLPAAFAPSEIVDATADVTWNAENSSLTVANDIEDSDGVDYSIVSNVPSFTIEQLQSGSDVIPPEIAARYLTLPSDLSPTVEDTALALTAGLDNRYDRMRAIQDHFRGYTYNVQLSPREGDPIEQFLREREGFCQQFAGTFALMARTLGIPARVATGFTWGDPIAQDPATGMTTYQVTGRQTHAWPEVYFDDFGWVAFEPTPGRGLPGAAGYTGVEALQDSLVEPSNPGQPTTTTTIDPNNIPDDTGPGFIEEPEIGDIPLDAGADQSGGFSVPWRFLLPLLVIAAYVGGVPAFRHFRRQARRNKADTPAHKVETAWAEAVEALELGFDVQRQSSETRSEFADRLESDRRVPSEEFGRLAEIATVARFHTKGVNDLHVEEADRLSTRVETAMENRVPIWNRLVRQLDPRRLVKPTKRVVNISPPRDEPAPPTSPPPPTQEMIDA